MTFRLVIILKLTFTIISNTRKFLEHNMIIATHISTKFENNSNRLIAEKKEGLFFLIMEHF